jgi:hypothetical protein
MTLTEILLSKILPKIKLGVEADMEVLLTGEECEAILELLNVSVSIETLIEHVVSLIQNTLGREKNTDFESIHLYAGDLHAPPKKSQ